ncbi:uncharacterized protein UTRI_00571 [Ustilago trichophora]|uniref:CCHC-type domain-containing protein n=1 Tax=Ustilago trichophora TaxID=86804 RepID=A0A5C3DRP6_9BASI|nr:uncharacterized protein UTRI_00571 [Ustilago trichophora]
MVEEFEYRLVSSHGAEPVMAGQDLHVEVETTGIPPGGVRWQFSTRYRVSKSSYRDVLLQNILNMCKKHRLTPLEIRHPIPQGGTQFVDVIFGNDDDVIKAYDGDIAFEFYGTELELVDRAMPNRKHVALCIQMLPSDSDMQEVLRALQENGRIRRAGKIMDVWSIHCRNSGRFNGKVLVLLELHTQKGAVTLEARTSIPGWFVFRNIAYLVRFADRPAWCFNCRYDEQMPFHSMHNCPVSPCSCCKKKDHTSVRCPTRQAQVARKPRNNQNQTLSSEDEDDGDDDDSAGKASVIDRASMERRFAELGIRDRSAEAEQLARDFGVLALSESDIGN